MSKTLRAIWTLLGLLAALPAGGVALAAPSTAATSDWGRLDSLATGRSVAGPAGWLNWCMAGNGRCAPADADATLPATPELLVLLERVQAEVNRSLAPQAEPPGRDLWQVGARNGDCEDYALAKQVRLRAAGLPAGAVRLATARLAHGELHAVLTVDTDRGTLVLDNLHARVMPWRSLDYAWQRAQGGEATLLWRELSAAPAPDPSRARPETARPDRILVTGTVAQ